MGNCVSSCRRQRQPRKPVTLALLGVDNAGKTTASNSFAGELVDLDEAPTVGFRSVKFTFDLYDITLYDVGGGRNIRSVWKNYFPEVYGFIFVVDASSTDRMEEARETFRETLEHPHVSGKPILLLANKQDKPEALDEKDLCEELDLESVVNINKCLCRIDTCTAIQGTGSRMDRHMREGLRWLLQMIDKEWEELNERVQGDTKAAEEVRKAETAARRERVRKLREERERQEEEERQRLGIQKKENEDEEEILEGDPFRPLDLNDLKKKEEALKAEKKRHKALEASLKAQGDSLVTEGPRTAPLNNNTLGEITSHDILEGGNVFSPRTHLSILPALEPLGTPFLENNSHKKKKKKKKVPLSTESKPPEYGTVDDDDDDDIVVGSPHTPTSTFDASHQKSTMTLSNIQVSPDEDSQELEQQKRGMREVSASVEGSDGGGDAYTPRRHKVKKRRLRQLGARLRSRQLEGGGGQEGAGHTAGSPPHLQVLDGGDIDENTGSSTEVAGEGKKSKMKSFLVNGHGWTGGQEKYQVSPRHVLSRESLGGTLVENDVDSKLPRHSQLHSNVSVQRDSLDYRTWGIGKDLPAVADDSIALRHQPNFTNEDDFLL